MMFYPSSRKDKCLGVWTMAFGADFFPILFLFQGNPVMSVTQMDTTFIQSV